MAKNKSIILTLILILFTALYLTNCDDDTITEPKKGGSTTPPTSVMEDLIGKWEVTNISITLGTIDTSGAPSDFASLGMPNQIFVTFYDDGTNQAELIWTDSTETVNGTWSVSGDQLTTTLPILEDDQVVTGTYTLSEDKNTMTFSTVVVAEYFGITMSIPAILTLEKRES